MRDRAEIAERLLAARATVRELEQHGAGGPSAHPAASTLQNTRLLAYRAYVEALAWALDIDLNQIDIPMTLLSGLAADELPTTVQLHRLELGEPPRPLVMWLAEIPAHYDERGPDYSTESWSCFLQDEQAHQLLAALTSALTPPTQRPLYLPLLGRSGALRGISQSASPSSVPPHPPISPDTAGGYADYAGLAAFADSNMGRDQEDESDDGDDQDEPPAAASAGGRGSR